MTLKEWKCLYCIHYLGGSTCSAFIDGIPREIFEGRNLHSKPLKNQINDLVFTPVKTNDDEHTERE